MSIISDARRHPLIAVTFVLIGCGELIGVDDYRIDDKGASSDDAGASGSCTTSSTSDKTFISGLNYISADCGNCVDAHCSAELGACRSDPACSEFAQCLALCEPCDHHCRGQCTGVAGAYSSPETTIFQQCEAIQCLDICNGLLVSFEDCDECLDDECHEALVRASTGAGMDDLDACKSGAGACRERCSAQVPDLGCLEHVVWPEPFATTASETLNVNVVDAIGIDLAVRGLNVQACWEGSLGCQDGPAEPVVGTTPASLTFSERDPHNDSFFGHLSASDPNEVYMKHLLYAFPWPSRDGALTVPVWTRAALTTQLADVVQDPANGLIFTDVFDCRGVAGRSRVPGVHVEITRSGSSSPDTTANFFYGYPLVLDPSGVTDANGSLVLIANVKGGYNYTVTAKIGEQIFGTVKVWVEADTVTSFHFVPTPSGG